MSRRYIRIHILQHDLLFLKSYKFLLVVEHEILLSITFCEVKKTS